jgi:hypothetical protein
MLRMDGCFAGEFILGRTEKEQGKTRYYIDLLEKRGPALREPYSKKINSSLYELRPGFGNTEMRIIYFWDGNLAWIVSGLIASKNPGFTAGVPDFYG